jgi:glycosyltransferase involved in cell wall biosynthesis
MNQLYISSKKISIVLPCLNEEDSISLCLDALLIIDSTYDLEIIVVDNNSSDQTVQRAFEYKNKLRNLHIISEPIRGYGSAIMRGIEYAASDYVYVSDADMTYDFNEISEFIKKLDEGYDMVIGNRFSGRMNSDAMPFHKKYIGNPVLSYLTRFLFKISIKDIHCGARAFRKDIYKKLSLYTLGMEFASEMIIKAAKNNCKITEIGISYNKRKGFSKLSSMSDGWRHLRFMLLYSPLYLFTIPGVFLFMFGALGISILYTTNIKLFEIILYVHPMFLFMISIIVGYQIIFFSMFSKIYSITHLGESDMRFENLLKKITLEKALAIGVLLIILGSAIFLWILIGWIKNDFSELNETKNLIIAVTSITLGIQTFFSGFMLSILGIKEK